jgi:uncharacterized membrane protein HdeD (DUF308 family)
MLVGGISDLALAAIVILTWSVSAARAMRLLVGINLITSGWAMVMVALGTRSFPQQYEPAATTRPPGTLLPS